MNLNRKLDLSKLFSIRPVKSGRMAYVQWDRQSIRYLVTSRDSKGLKVLRLAQLNRADESHPLVQAAEDARQAKVGFSQVEVLLTRADLELLNLSLPPCEDEEMPELVRALSEEQLGETEEEPQVDFIASGHPVEGGREVFAFALSGAVLEELHAAAKEADVKLVAVVPRSLASLGLLRDRSQRGARTEIAITTFDQEIELIVLRQGKPAGLRTLRTQAEEIEGLAEQLVIEINRCLASAGVSPDLDDLHLIVFGDRARFETLADLLVGQFGGPVSMMGPLDGMRYGDSIDLDDVHTFAAIAGAARDDAAKERPINLLAPRKPPKAPSPYRRAGLIGGLAVAALIAVVYTCVDDLRTLQGEYDQLKEEVTQETKLANKMAENASKVRVAETWLADEVNWLEELKDLSERLPGGDKVTIRRLNAATVAAGAVIDLSVQVSEPEEVADLEQAVRAYASSVTSKRVSEQAADSEYPWQFETRIVIDRRSFQSEAEEDAAEEDAAEEGAAEEAADEEAAVVNETTEAGGDSAGDSTEGVAGADAEGDVTEDGEPTVDGSESEKDGESSGGVSDEEGGAS